jgi:hypothetical protein
MISICHINKTKNKISKLKLADNLTYFVIPLFICLQINLIFICSAMCLSIIRFRYLLKEKKEMPIGAIIKHFLDKSFWIIFNILYLIYYII